MFNRSLNEFGLEPISQEQLEAYQDGFNDGKESIVKLLKEVIEKSKDIKGLKNSTSTEEFN